MNIVEFYKEFEQCLNVVDENNDGYLSAKYGNKYTPVVVAKKRLVLPVKELLRNPPTGVIFFHPLGENPNRSESDVIKHIKMGFWLAHTSKINILASVLLDIAASPAKHKTLNEAGSYLKHFPDDKACAKAMEKFEKIRVATSKEPTRRYFNISFKFGEGKLEGKGYVRESVLNYPILEELSKDQDTVFGVKVTKSEKQVIKSLFEYVLGDEEERKQYGTGTNNLIAPYFECVAKTVAKIATKFNALIDFHKGHTPSLENEKYPTEWISKLDDLEQYKGLIPSQEGNEGVCMLTEESPSNKPFDVNQSLVDSIYSESQPEPQEQRQQGNKMDFRSMYGQQKIQQDRRPQDQYERQPQRQQGNRMDLKDFYNSSQTQNNAPPQQSRQRGSFDTGYRRQSGGRYI